LINGPGRDGRRVGRAPRYLGPEGDGDSLLYRLAIPDDIQISKLSPELPPSLSVMAIMFFDGLIYGHGQPLMPVGAVNLFGYTTPQWSQLVAMMGLIGAGAFERSAGPTWSKGCVPPW
jgi:hypothetical protein